MELSKIELKTIKSIGRWRDGHCEKSKAYSTHKKLVDKGLLTVSGKITTLTKAGREVYKTLGEID
ncbi:hypothetical protein [Pseudoalteromonas sp.]|uniref:hypothetical protein n=1 Tax=Pseudoalteromonas sp. TaxID=53249 RepID=UPI003D0AA8EB